MVIRKHILFALILASLQACQLDDESRKSSNQVNGEKPTIKGYLYFENPESYIQYAIASAEVKALYGQEGSGIKPEYDLLAANYAVPVSVPNDYVTDEVIVADSNKDVLMYLPLTESIYSPIKFSPDGKLIAFKWWPYYDNSLKNGLAVFDMNGNNIQLFANPDHSGDVRYTSFDWIDNNSLVIAANDTLFEADTVSGDIRTLYRLADENVVQDLDVDPEGKKIVISVGDGEIVNHIYWSNLESWKLYELTRSNLNEMNPVWSPDGEYIAFRYGYRAGYPTPPEYRACPEVYLAKVEPNKTYQLSTGNTSEGLHLLMETQDSGSVVSLCAFSDLTWSEKSFKE